MCSQDETVDQTITRFGQLLTPVILSFLSLTLLLINFAFSHSTVQAAPGQAPLTEIISGVLTVAHTSATTHEMRVFGDGRITDRFYTDLPPDNNQIDQSGLHTQATTIAIYFDQHALTSNLVDVAVQDEFLMTQPITLNTLSNYTGYLEDSLAIFASQTLAYRVKQQTLARAGHNCAVMGFQIENTGTETLTGGKFLFRLNIDTAMINIGDEGYYDPTRQMVYMVDYNRDRLGGFAVGVSLLQGDWHGFSITTTYAVDDAGILNELLTPGNDIFDNSISGVDRFVSLVTNIPDLTAGEISPVIFGMCARAVDDPDEDIGKMLAKSLMYGEFNQLVSLDIQQAANPPTGSLIAADSAITYTIQFSNTGSYPVTSLLITNPIPANTNLLAYQISQGSIVNNNGVLEARLDSLAPSNGTVTMQFSVQVPFFDSIDGTEIRNQAYVNSDPIITVNQFGDPQRQKPTQH